MADGVITGGWSYVIVAYAVTFAGLLAHTVSLIVRRRHLESARRRKKGRDE